VEGSGGWTETVGIADRSCYDLGQHAKHANVDLTVRFAQWVQGGVSVVATVFAPCPCRLPHS
jgi:glycyl-tRNA synthetase (class II)